MSDSDDWDCPLCMEEMDMGDRGFRPCECGYQICSFCYHRIKDDLNGQCPACRRLYSEQTPVIVPVASASNTSNATTAAAAAAAAGGGAGGGGGGRNKRQTNSRRGNKERDIRRDSPGAQAGRQHLSHLRVMQRNLVYVLGLPIHLCAEEILGSNEYFGQFGRVVKVATVVSRKSNSYNSAPMTSAYITYARNEDASVAIDAVDGCIMESGSRPIRATYGTTKYCPSYLRYQECTSDGCMYLHEPGPDEDSYTKEDLLTGKLHSTSTLKNHNENVLAPFPLYPTPQHRQQQQQQQQQPQQQQQQPQQPQQQPQVKITRQRIVQSQSSVSTLPPTASWAKTAATGLSTTPQQTITQSPSPKTGFYSEFDAQRDIPTATTAAASVAAAAAASPRNEPEETRINSDVKYDAADGDNNDNNDNEDDDDDDDDDETVSPWGSEDGMSVSDEHDEDEEPSNRSTPSTQPESQPQPQPQSDACSSTSISISISRSPSVEEKTMDQPLFVQPQVLAKSVPTVQPLDVSSVFDPSSLLSITPVTASTPMASIQPRSLISRHSSVMAFDPFSVGRRQSLLSPADTLSGHIWPTLHQPSFAPKVGSGHSVYGNTVPHYHSTLAQNANSATMLDRQPLQHQQLPRSSSISTSPMVSNVSGQQSRQLTHSSSDYIALEDILKVSQEERDRTVAGMMSAISSGVPLSSLATKVHAELIRLDKQLENVLRSTSKSNEMIERVCLRV